MNITMDTIFFVIFSILATAKCQRISGFQNLQPAAVSTQEVALSRAIQELGLDISVNQWNHGNYGNVVLSPVGISALLSVILLSSNGNSNFQLRRLLHLPNNITEQAVHGTFKDILGNLRQFHPGVTVSLESSLFVTKGLPMLAKFTDVAQGSYRVNSEGVNFAGDPTGAMNIINKWVERASYGKITNLISRPFRSDTKFVAANVIYFNGKWQYPFDEQITKNGIFYTGLKNISIPMMTNIMTVPFLKTPNNGFKMIALPYEGGKYSMIIITPSSESKMGGEGIRQLQLIESFLDYNLLQNLYRQMTNQKVSVNIPRMKLSSKIHLKKTLQELGATDIFEPLKADLGRMSSQSGIFVEDIVHEATIEVTESGTVAAAASAATFDRIGGNEMFHLNRPSLLFIRDNSNGLPLFSCRVVEPQSI